MTIVISNAWYIPKLNSKVYAGPAMSFQSLKKKQKLLFKYSVTWNCSKQGCTYNSVAKSQLLAKLISAAERDSLLITCSIQGVFH